MVQTRRIEVHAHLLPGVDDGCPTLEDSLACARLFVERGYSHCFCTPHVWPSLPNNRPAEIARRVGQLQRELDRQQIPLKVMPGGELTLGPHLLMQSAEQIVSYDLANRVVLMDFWCETLPADFEPTVRRLQGLGLTVILAHPERMKAVQDDPGLAEVFRQMGVLLQGNLGCLSDPPEHPNRRCGQLLLERGAYHLLGSDCHNAAALPSRLDGLETAIAVVGAEAVDRMTVQNPRQLMAGA